MKEIKALIKPFILEKVLSALDEIGDLPGVTVSEVMGWGRLPEHDQGNDAETEGHGFSNKTKIEIVVKDEQAAAVVDAIRKSAYTGKPGDGKIFVYDVSEVVRIRTGESGTDAV